MNLPNARQAHIPPEKITAYLLDIEHEDGRGKALFFMRFGFTAAHWETLAQALIAHANEHEVTKQETTSFGIRYVIEGEIQTPSQRSPLIRVVWFIGNNEDIPRLVTAYPLEEQND